MSIFQPQSQPTASSTASSALSDSSSSSSGSSSSGSSDSSSSDSDTNSETGLELGSDDVKSEYRKLKSKLLELIKVNEMLQDELKLNKQRLLTINMDKYFLMERLLAYEKPPARKYTKKSSSKPEETPKSKHESYQTDEEIEIEDLDDDSANERLEIVEPVPEHSAKKRKIFLSKSRQSLLFPPPPNTLSSPSSSDMNDDG